VNLLATLLWLANLVCDTVGQLAFKASTHRAARDTRPHWQALTGDPFLWLGIAAYAGEAFLWLAFLSLVPLSQGVMMGSFNMILVMIGGRLFFHETLTPRRLGAIGLIATGVTLVGWGGA